jgi:DNA repair exonuclease SbcCD ATPase subunit
MKLYTLKMTDFLAHARFSHEFDTPITIFAGPNESGKSSVTGAIEVALTGKTRGLIKNQAAMLSRGMAPFSVEAVWKYDGKSDKSKASPNKVTPTAKTWQSRIGVDEETMFCATRWDHYASLDVKKREKLLANVVGGQAWTGPALPGEIETARQKGGLQAALRKATEVRRNRANVLAEIKPHPPTTRVVVRGSQGNEVEVEVSGLKQSQVNADLVQAESNRRSKQGLVIKAAGASDEARIRLAELKEAAATRPKLEGDLKEAQASLEKATKDANESAAVFQMRSEKLSKIDVELSMLKKALSIFDDEVAECPTCLQPLVDGGRQAIEKNIVALNGAHSAERTLCDAARDEADKHRRAYTHWQGKVNDGRDNVRMLDQQKGELERMEKAVAEAGDMDLSAAQAELDAAHEAHSIARTRVNALEVYGQALSTYEDNQRRQKAVKESHDLFQKFELMIQEVIANKSDDGIGLLQRNMKSFGAFWGVEVGMASDMLPTWGGVPYTLLSRSGKYMASLAVQFALARISGFNFIIVDDVDILTKDRRMKLVGPKGFYAQFKDDLQVVACCAVDNPKDAKIESVRMVAIGG